MEQDYRNSDDEHIYENVVSVTRYKYNKILNGIFNSFTPKRDKLPTPSSSPPIHRSLRDDMSSCEFYENSYTSCEDDNIYENLEFFDAYDDDNFLHNVSALDDWLRNLSREIDDYETDNYIFIKSIPSVLQAQCGSITHRNVSKSEITLNFLKSLWQEDRVGMMSFLLETFSNLLRLQQSTVSVEMDNEPPSVKKREKFSSRRRRNYQQKLELVILSSSLNSLIITYNESLKFYFALSQRSKTFHSRLSAGDVSVVEVLVTIRKNFRIKFASKSERKEFYKRLKLILSHKLSEIDQLNSAVALRENCENIYQPIWTCQSSSTTDKRSAMVISENIYAQLMTNECVADEHEWEIDDEFSFVTSMMIRNNNYIEDKTAIMTADMSAYRTVWILYNDDNPTRNKIIYDQNSFMKSLNSASDCSFQQESPLSENKSIISTQTMQISEKILNSVECWKNDLRRPCNMEDEEDFFVSDSILSMDFCKSNESSFNNSNFSLESDVMNKSVYSDAMSTSLHFGTSENNLMPTKSLESFRSATDEPEGLPTDSPRKDRFRDKMLSKLRLKSSRTVNISDHSLNESTKSENDDDVERHKIFGCNLDFVEKDGYYKEIPKFVVECVKYLEIESNLRTSGIYRISGNKTVMDGLKKKMNDKKLSKKESSKYACLQEQDVHTLTGLLKMFFRELNPPLMSKEVFASCTSEKLNASQMKEKLTEMPSLNLALLRYLFRHFKSVERYAKENSMTSQNIAICCGIGLFSGGDDSIPFDQDIGKCNTLCKFFIDNYREVFE